MEVMFTTPYVSTDGEFTFDINELPTVVIDRAVRRAFNHVFGNEVAAKVKDLSGDARAIKERELRDVFLAKMRTSEWGDSATRGPRAVKGDRLETIYQMLLADAARKAVNKMGIPAGDEKDTWKLADATLTLDRAKEMYINNAKLGAQREEELRDRASTKHAAELADREKREAGRVREAGTQKGSAASLESLEL